MLRSSRVLCLLGLLACLTLPLAGQGFATAEPGDGREES